MRAERFGSYSMEVTVAGMPVFSRLKSITRYCCLCPPPMKREVVSPELRRPPERFFGSSNALCGRSVVNSWLTSVVLKRCVGVIALYALIAIFISQLPAQAFRPVWRPDAAQWPRRKCHVETHQRFS